MSLTNTNTTSTTTSSNQQPQQQQPTPPPTQHPQQQPQSSQHPNSEDESSTDADHDDEDDLDDDKPCDLRLLTPATCLREYKTSLVGQAVSYLASQPSSLVSSHLQSDANNVSPAPITTAHHASQSMHHNASTTNALALAAALYHTHQQHHLQGAATSGEGLKVEQPLHHQHHQQLQSVVTGGAFTCDRCGNSYARPHSLNRHKRFECGVEPKFECPVCHKKSKHKHNLVLHMRTHSQR